MRLVDREETAIGSKAPWLSSKSASILLMFTRGERKRGIASTSVSLARVLALVKQPASPTQHDRALTSGCHRCFFTNSGYEPMFPGRLATVACSRERNESRYTLGSRSGELQASLCSPISIDASIRVYTGKLYFEIDYFVRNDLIIEMKKKKKRGNAVKCLSNPGAGSDETSNDAYPPFHREWCTR